MCLLFDSEPVEKACARWISPAPARHPDDVPVRHRAEVRVAEEEANGRKIRGFMSVIEVDEDISCEVFTLEPTPRR
jgi:hypothetical protein